MPSGAAQCFSTIVNQRCQGLSSTEYTTAFIPIGLEVLLVPILLAITWSKPRITSILLSIEILIGISTAGWDLVLHVTPGHQNSHQTQDLVLAITSSLPVLFILLFATALLLSDIRAVLPPALQSTKFTLAFTFLATPLVPIGFLATTVSSFLLIRYNTVGAETVLGFTDFNAKIHRIFILIGSITTSTYLTIPLLSSLFLLRPPTTHSYPPPSTPFPLLLIPTSFLLLITDLLLSLIPTTPSNLFTLLLIKRITHLLARTTLTMGLLAIYSSSSAAAPSSHKRDKRQRKTWSSFGIPKVMAERGVKNGPGKGKGRGEGGGGGGGGLRDLKLIVGSPVLGTFSRMSTEGTRVFHDSHGKGRNGGGNGERAVPAERVIFRTPAARPPVLSFTSSTFDSISLQNLANVVQFQPPVPVILPSRKENDQYENTNIGSIYAPQCQPRMMPSVRVPAEGAVSPPPLPRPPRSIARLSYTAPRQGVTNPFPSRDIPKSSPNAENPFKTTPNSTTSSTPTPIPRINSIKRKPVPSPQPYQPQHQTQRSREIIIETPPSPTASSILIPITSLALTSRPLRSRQNTDAQNAIVGVVPTTPPRSSEIISPVSQYSTNSTSPTTLLQGTSLFFKPPRQSPTSTNKQSPSTVNPSPIKSSPTSEVESESAYSPSIITIEHDDSTNAYGYGYGYRDTMRSLQRLGREAGIRADPERLGSSFGGRGLGFVLEEEEGEWGENEEGRRVSGVSIGLSLRSLDSEDLTPRAGDEGGKRTWLEERRGVMV